MANQLKMAMVNAILTLTQRGWSQRRIARVLGIGRETVARYVNLRESDSKPATNAPTGSDGPKPAKAPIGLIDQDTQKPGPESQCEPFRKVIEDKLQDGLTRQRIYQDLTDEYGFDGSYYSVRRFVKRLRENKPIPFRRIECMPGDEVQVDFGTAAPIVRYDGTRKRPHVFRIVLSFSRKAYSEVVYRQTTDNFIRCLENAFWHFGGVPKTLIIDNLKAAVKNADWYDPDIIGGALQLDGSDDYVKTGFILNPAEDKVSVFAWIKDGAPGQTIISQEGGADWLLTDTEGNLITDLKAPGRSGKPLLSQTEITDGNWHRIGLVWDGYNRILYVDGVVVAEDTQANLEGSDNGLYLGCGKNMESGTFWSGLIDDIRIYNRVVQP